MAEVEFCVRTESLGHVTRQPMPNYVAAVKVAQELHGGAVSAVPQFREVTAWRDAVGYE
jgi:hypothetical protein